MLQINELRLGIPLKWGLALETVAKEKILPASQNEVPVDTGALKSTGRVNKTFRSASGARIKVTIAYGGKWGTGDIGSSGRLHVRKFVDYATLQHEANFSHRVGKKKYLEDPVYRYKPIIDNMIETRMRRLLYEIFSK